MSPAPASLLVVLFLVSFACSSSRAKRTKFCLLNFLNFYIKASMDPSNYFAQNPGRFEHLDQFSDEFFIETLHSDPLLQIRVAFAALALKKVQHTTLISFPLYKSYGFLMTTSNVHKDCQDLDFIVSSGSKNAFLLYHYLPENNMRHSTNPERKGILGYCANVRIGADGRVSVNFSARPLSCLQLGTRGNVNFSRYLQTEEVMGSVELDLANANMTLLTSLKDNTKTSASFHLSFPTLPQFSAGFGFIKTAEKKQCMCHFLFSLKLK
jgi:hypothetical protein